MQVMLVIGSGWWWYLNLEITSAAARSRSRFPQGATRGFLRGIPMVDEMPWNRRRSCDGHLHAPSPHSELVLGRLLWPTSIPCLVPLCLSPTSESQNCLITPLSHCSALKSFQSLEFWPFEFCSLYTHYTPAVFHTQCFFRNQEQIIGQHSTLRIFVLFITNAYFPNFPCSLCFAMFGCCDSACCLYCLVCRFTHQTKVNL